MPGFWASKLALSDKYLSLSEALLNVLRDAHFSFETAMKAVIRRQKVAVIKTHDLRELANIKVNGREFLSRKLIQSPEVRRSFSVFYTTWRSEDKYRVLNVTPSDVAIITLHCGKVHQWLMKELSE